MQDFLKELFTSGSFVQMGAIAAILASVASGCIGSYVVTLRISYIAGAIAHCILGGMGIAHYLKHAKGVEWILPLHGAIIASLIATAIIGTLTLRRKERADTILGAVWSIGMAIGLYFMYITPGYNQELSGYLFGSITMVSTHDIILVAILDALVILIVVLFYGKLLAVSFDEEFARLRGINVHFWYLLLLCLTALTVVLLVQLVGIVLVIALLTLPPATAGRFTQRLGSMMALATVFALTCTLSGMAVSYGPNLEPGAMIVLIAGSLYVICLAGGKIISRLRIMAARS